MSEEVEEIDEIDDEGEVFCNMCGTLNPESMVIGYMIFFEDDEDYEHNKSNVYICKKCLVTLVADALGIES